MSLDTGLGKRTTAAETLRGISLHGFNAIVTGASSGLGVETTRALARAGASVTLAVRNLAAGEKVAADLRAENRTAQLVVQQLDLSSMGSVRTFAATVKGPLHLLINNAGIMAPPRALTPEGFESQMGTNHLGHFLLTTLLLPTLTPNARVVTLSSDLHRRGTGENVMASLDSDRTFSRRKYSGFGAYGDSKLANALFAVSLAKRLAPGQLAFSVHPGVIATNLSRSMGLLAAPFSLAMKLFSKNPEQGAATTVFAATAPELVGHSGAYLADCDLKRASAEAQDAALAEHVWALSEQAVQSSSARHSPSL